MTKRNTGVEAASTAAVGRRWHARDREANAGRCRAP